MYILSHDVVFFVGLGPGGLKDVSGVESPSLGSICLPGSNHGGTVSAPTGHGFQLGDPYNKENLTTFQGGSGGDATFLLSVYLFLLFYLSFSSASNVLSWPKTVKYFR